MKHLLRLRPLRQHCSIIEYRSKISPARPALAQPHWLIATCVIAIAIFECHADDAINAEPSSRRWGIRLCYSNKSVDIPNVASSAQPACIAVGIDESGRPIAVCSIGDSISTKGHAHHRRGGDPGGCVIFVDATSGAVERTNYHHPRPDYVATSLNGKYVALASTSGWVDAKRNVTDTESTNDTSKTWQRATTSGSKGTTDGAMRYSIWETATAKPVWEMRFYGPHAKDAALAKFYHPRDDYADLSMPQPAIDSHIISVKNCQTGFSPDSKYFIALDSDHGIHILRLDDGLQLHARTGSPPVLFYFNYRRDRIQLICSNGLTQQVELATGMHVGESRALPAGASMPFQNDQDGMLGTNFVVDAPTGMFGIIRPDGLFIIKTRAAGDRVNKDVIRSQRGFEGLCRIQLSPDLRYVGLGFGSRYSGTDDCGRLTRFELADLRSGRVIRRLVRASDLNSVEAETGRTSTDSAGVPTTQIATHACACLTADGSDIAYVLPLQSTRSPSDRGKLTRGHSAPVQAGEK
jgi:hypothetical protein